MNTDTAPRRPFAFPVQLDDAGPGCDRAERIANAYLDALGLPSTCEGWVLVVQAKAEGDFTVPPTGAFVDTPFGRVQRGEGYALGLVLLGALSAYLRESANGHVADSLDVLPVRPFGLAAVLWDHGEGDRGPMKIVNLIRMPKGRYAPGGDA